MAAAVGGATHAADTDASGLRHVVEDMQRTEAPGDCWWGIPVFASSTPGPARMAGDVESRQGLAPIRAQARVRGLRPIEGSSTTIHTIHTVRDACAATDSKSAEETVQKLARAAPRAFGFDTYWRTATSLMRVYPAFFAWWRRSKGL